MSVDHNIELVAANTRTPVHKKIFGAISMNASLLKETNLIQDRKCTFSLLNKRLI